MRRLFVVIAVVALGACATNTQTGDAESAIRQGDINFSQRFGLSDAAGVAGIYAQDATLLPPNAPAVHGREAIRQMWGGLMSTGKGDVTLTADNITQSGDLAVEVGRYQFNFTPNGATAAIPDHGKYVVVWKKINGQWQIAEDIYNSDLPPTAPH
jgi:ketosteroid isomerase-like protein